MFFVKDNNVIQTIASDTTNEPFGVWILPRTSRCGLDLFDTQTFDALAKIRAINLIAIT